MFNKILIMMALLALSACAIDPADETSETEVAAPLMGISAVQAAAPVADPDASAPVVAPPPVDTRLQSGRASRYKLQDHGIATASGEVYDMFDLTAAHSSLPFGSYVRVTNTVNQRSVVVRINDRNEDNKLVRLSHRAAKLLGLPAVGGFVKLQALQPKSK
ncbi:MAG: Endolytic peptidoglycan transglycosylase RlpA [Pseudomonadota bacterium]|jgi:rare lipoprotein A